MQDIADESAHYEAPGFTVADLEESIGGSYAGSYWTEQIRE